MKMPVASPQMQELVKPKLPQDQVSQTSVKTSFGDILDGLRLESGDGLSQIAEQIASGKKVSPTELLGYQMRVSRFGLKIELSSKVAEAVTGTIRKLETTSQ